MSRLDAVLLRNTTVTRAFDRLMGALAPSLDAGADTYVGYTCCPIRSGQRCDVFINETTGRYTCNNCTGSASC